VEDTEMDKDKSMTDDVIEQCLNVTIFEGDHYKTSEARNVILATFAELRDELADAKNERDEYWKQLGHLEADLLATMAERDAALERERVLLDMLKLAASWLDEVTNPDVEYSTPEGREVSTKVYATIAETERQRALAGKEAEG
jgi:hypothetical protein